MSRYAQNQVIVLNEHPTGMPDKRTFRIKDIDMPEIKEGEVLLKSLYVSVDPGMRGFMEEGKSATGLTFDIGDPITSRTVAEVVDSKSSVFTAGDIVHGRLSWQKFQRAKPHDVQQVDPDLAPISTAVSTLGVTGLAAYFGMIKIGRPQKGETVVVSGAAGAVGSIAGQIGKIMGCRVVGTAGSDRKVSYLEDDLGIDKAINYKSVGDLPRALQEACPDGVDIYFDNVGGELSDRVFKLINRHARIVVCGQISEYNAEKPPTGPRPQHLLIRQSAKMEGFVVFDFAEQFAQAEEQLARWYNDGTLKHRETVTEGFDKIPEAFIGLFKGDNIGKQLVKVAEQGQ